MHIFSICMHYTLQTLKEYNKDPATETRYYIQTRAVLIDTFGVTLKQKELRKTEPVR